MNRIVVITGASSGIGLATARLFCRKGDKVYCLSRTKPEDGNINHIACDVTSDDSVSNAFEAIKAEAGRIDVLILNAGYGISGAAENTDTNNAIKQFNVNFFGAVRCIGRAGDLLRSSDGGRIIFISSLAALIPIPFQSFYSSSKSALLTFSRSLSSEMRQFGIKVTAVCPGDVRTAFTENRRKNRGDDEKYLARSAKAVETMENDERHGMSPETVARVIYKISCKRCVKKYYTAGLSYKFLMFASRLFPPSLVDYIVRKIYI